MPVQEQPGTNSGFRKATKAFKAFRTILGLFHKSSKQKSETGKESNEDRTLSLSSASERKFSQVESPSRDSPNDPDESNDSPRSRSDTQEAIGQDSMGLLCLDGSPNTAMLVYDERDSADDGFNEESMSINGNHDEEDFPFKWWIDAHGPSDVSDDVFITDSYYLEDDYFEDFSSSSDPLPPPSSSLAYDIEEFNVPIFTPVKSNRTKSCCQKYLETPVEDMPVFRSKSKLVRTSSMPSLRNLTLDRDPVKITNIEDSPKIKNVDHLLRSPEEYFTFNVDMITDDFYHANANDDEEKDKSKDRYTYDSGRDPVLGDSPRVFYLHPKPSPAHSRGRGGPIRITPVKASISIESDGRSVLLTPCKSVQGNKRFVKLSGSISASPPHKRSRKTRKVLFQDERPRSSPLSPTRSIVTNRDTGIVDGLYPVADWILNAVAVNGFTVERTELDISEQNGHTIKPISNGSSVRRVLEKRTFPPDKKLSLNSFEKDTIQKSPKKEKYKRFNANENIRVKMSSEKEKYKHANAPDIFLNSNASGGNEPHSRLAPSEPRSRLDSGYAGRSSWCSTPIASPREPITPMSKLQVGKILSPQSLNTLDGLTIQQKQVRRQGRTANLLFPPPAQSFSGFKLKAVPELTESVDFIVPAGAPRIPNVKHSIKPTNKVKSTPSLHKTHSVRQKSNALDQLQNFLANFIVYPCIANFLPP